MPPGCLTTPRYLRLGAHHHLVATAWVSPAWVPHTGCHTPGCHTPGSPHTGAPCHLVSHALPGSPPALGLPLVPRTWVSHHCASPAWASTTGSPAWVLHHLVSPGSSTCSPACLGLTAAGFFTHLRSPAWSAHLGAAPGCHAWAPRWCHSAWVPPPGVSLPGLTTPSHCHLVLTCLVLTPGSTTAPGCHALVHWSPPPPECTGCHAPPGSHLLTTWTPPGAPATCVLLLPGLHLGLTHCASPLEYHATWVSTPGCTPESSTTWASYLSASCLGSLLPQSPALHLGLHLPGSPPLPGATGCHALGLHLHWVPHWSATWCHRCHAWVPRLGVARLVSCLGLTCTWVSCLGSTTLSLTCLGHRTWPALSLLPPG
ncbi:hypothetical protein GPJ56_007211 [Histomonas meleagridis]|nr:hypothetical protein GPJ56_007211 [Histomonas meleagridis]